MHNVYHKVAVVSICTALSFTLVTNKEAKAATFNLTPTKFYILESAFSLNSIVQIFNSDEYNEVGVQINFAPQNPPRYTQEHRFDGRAFYEFNIGDLSLPTNTIVSSAILNIPIGKVTTNYPYMNLDLYGYVGNGQPDTDDFNAGGFLSRQNSLNGYPFHHTDFDVTNFVNQRVSNGNNFAGFGLRVEIGSLRQGSPSDYGKATLSYGNDQPTLTIETVDAEPVPEPTTIFGSVLALGIGGWVKRKKSSQQNKTTSQQ